ncbi:uncharacterized protein LMH87_007618 [Akanthomyces muscarius]|uniref:Transcription factor domain-containing protein n=1 Tax=Akanthomyces muscarius TaxID=2231603 RepID=A0A9W8QM02_AKAMU|nr:uncharacterized protein LMH87_007618 [Akanthomyces muscarius]KAJ4161587.1 hypothetical protein LMH87_007618 [Akanthomyces muscarius]
MGPPNLPPFRLDCMGDFGDDDQRPVKRIRLDQVNVGQYGAPPEGHEHEFPEGWSASQSFYSDWIFPSATSPLPMSIFGSGAGMGLNSSAPINSPMTAHMISPVDGSMAQVPRDMHFHTAPNLTGISATFPASQQHAIDTNEAPQLLPFQFGLNIAMDAIGRQLFAFYIHNWCPGRTVLTKTNVWLTGFASIQYSPGVLAAIQSLAGIYIYDYLPSNSLQRQVNKKFAIAEARLSELLQDTRSLDDNESSELVMLALLLSMQDVVLTERRLQKPYHPRWLVGFTQAEHVLQFTDPGSRFYKEQNVQVSSLRLSQSVIVGRAVILAQLMMPLPPIDTFDPIAETKCFGFLLYGSEADMYEIHGGCGFSKRVLHIFSQVAYCSLRILQDAETPIVPITAQMLYEQLLQLHQWSGEYDSWEAAKSRPQPIEWIRQTDENYVIQEAKEMTEVTAEAWRIAGIVYLQCRLFRLPRNHYMVVNNIADLAKCISITPASGPIFTAQAPLLPAFFLGLLATMEEHIQVAEIWFQQVIKTPVRSTVPPLYRTLERIQSWLFHEVPVPAINMELPHAIAERQPWWERMVSKVQKKENEVLCLT